MNRAVNAEALWALPQVARAAPAFCPLPPPVRGQLAHHLLGKGGGIGPVGADEEAFDAAIGGAVGGEKGEKGAFVGGEVGHCAVKLDLVRHVASSRCRSAVNTAIT